MKVCPASFRRPLRAPFVARDLRCFRSCVLFCFFLVGSICSAVQSAEIPLSRDESLALSSGAMPDPCERYRARNWLRKRIVRESDLGRYGLVLDEGWERAPAERPVVVLIHGFNSTRDQN